MDDKLWDMDWDAFLALIAQRAQKDSDRKQDRSKRTEQQILNAALRVFARDGISRTRLGDIAAEAGISASTLYEYYSSKEDLAYVVPMAHFTQFYAEYTEAVAGKSSAYDRLHLFLSMSADFARRNAEWARLYYLEIWPSVLVVDSKLCGIVDDFARIVVYLVRQGEENGEWTTNTDPYETASILMGSVNQVVITWLLYRHPKNLTKAGAAIVERTLSYLQTEAETRKKAAKRPLARAD